MRPATTGAATAMSTNEESAGTTVQLWSLAHRLPTIHGPIWGKPKNFLNRLAEQGLSSASFVIRVPKPGACGCSSMVEPQLPKLMTGVRFSSPAPRETIRRGT